MSDNTIDALKEIQKELELNSNYDGFWWPDDLDKLDKDELKELAIEIHDIVYWHERTLLAIDTIVDQTLFSEMLKG
jgi:hypothetical protein